MTAIRDALHESPASRCTYGSDLCDDWAPAIEIADRIRAEAGRYIANVLSIQRMHGVPTPLRFGDAEVEAAVHEVAMATVPLAVAARVALIRRHRTATPPTPPTPIEGLVIALREGVERSRKRRERGGGG